MKTIKNLAFYAILITMIGLVGCQKEEQITQEPIAELQNEFNQKVSVVDNMLYFETIAGYENTIEYLGNLGDENFEKWENDLSFNSMRQALSEEEREKLGIEDDLLATVLNKNRLIQIEDNIFQVDLPNEVVLMVKASDYDSTRGSDLTVFNTKSDVRTFSIDDDILGIIEGNVEENIEKGGCSRQKKGYYTTYTNYGWVKRKVAYQKAGFYYSIIGKIKQEYAYPRCHIQLKTYNYDGVNFGVKNKSSYDCDNKINFNRTSKGGSGTSYSWRPYNSTRSLKRYKWHVEYYYYDNVNSWGPKLKITCGSSCP